MITKGIIEELVSPYEVKVRIPIFDGSSQSSNATATKDLNTATMCSLPNCLMNLQVGDIVFVGFEDNTHYKAVILGCLVKETGTTSYSDIDLNKLVVHGTTQLSEATSIGNVTPAEISNLLNTRDNIQKQLDALRDQLDIVSKKLSL